MQHRQQIRVIGLHTAADPSFTEITNKWRDNSYDLSTIIVRMAKRSSYLFVRKQWECMEHCSEIASEPTQSIWIRISRQTNV